MQHFETADKDIRSKIQNKQKRENVIGEVEGLRNFSPKDVMEVEVYMDSRGDWKITGKLLPIIVLPTGGVPLAHSRKDVRTELVTTCRAVARLTPLFNAYSKYVYGTITSVHIDITELASLVLATV